MRTIENISIGSAPRMIAQLREAVETGECASSSEVVRTEFHKIAQSPMLYQLRPNIGANVRLSLLSAIT